MICFGIAVPAMLIAPVVDSPPEVTIEDSGIEVENPAYTDWVNTWGVQQYYRVIFALPAFFAII